MPHRDEPTAADGARETNEEDLGRILEKARAARGLTLEAVAAELRMEPRLLEALEANRLGDLGAPVFAKGYLKQYGNRLGLSYNDLLGEYYKLADSRHDVEIAPSRVIKVRDERQITVWILAGLAVALIVVFLFVWWLGQPAGGSVSSAAPAEAASPGSGSDLGSTVPLRARDAAAAAPVSADPASRAEPAPTAVETAPTVESAVDPEAPAAATEAGAASIDASADAERNSIAHADAASAGPRVGIEIEFAEDCWVELTGADGEQVFYGLGRAGARSSLSAAAPVKVFLGNAGGISLTVDGAPYPVPRSGRQGNLARFTIDTPSN